MRLNVEQVRRRIDAVVDGRDDRLVVLLRCEARRVLQRELLHWIRSLVQSYEDDLEVLVHACYTLKRSPGGAAGSDGARGPYDLARILMRSGLPVVFSTYDIELDGRLAAVTAWTIRWSFDLWGTRDTHTGRLLRDIGFPRAANQEDRSGCFPGSVPKLVPKRRPGIVVPPGLVHVPAARAARTAWDGVREGLLVDLTGRPGNVDLGHVLARDVGEMIRDDNTNVIGAFVEATSGSTEPYVPGSFGRHENSEWSVWNVDAVESMLDVLANAVRQRRLVMATRPRGSLWQRL